MNEKIIPFSYRRLADKRRAFPLFFTLIFISGILVVLSMTLKTYAGVVSLLAVVSLTASTMVYLRYITSDYTYSVREGTDNEAFLIFTKITGKRQSMMGCVPLYAINSIQKFTKDGLKQHKPSPSAKKYNFAPTFSPDEVYIIKAKTRTESYEVVVEATEDFANRIREYSIYAREDYLKEEEEED